MNKDLSEVKPGDVVLVHNGGFMRGFQRMDVLEEVDRVTKTMIMIGERRYRRSNGMPVGDGMSYNAPWISIPSDEDKVRVGLQQKRARALRILERLEKKIKNLSEEQLDKIIELAC